MVGQDVSTRERVRRAVHDHRDPVGVADLATALHVHPNTVRFHLDTLERSGEIERLRSGDGGPGRPRAYYRRRAESGPRRFDVLAAMLLAGLGSGEDARARASEIGAAWGRNLAHDRSSDRDAPRAGLRAALDEVGFDPTDDADDAMTLHNCPFRELVDPSDRRVCDLHAGLMRGILAGWDAGITLSRLDPFVEPGICRAHLTSTEVTA
ncbi:helix-turn-helix transcriptional regulator [Microbacterium aurum]